MSRKNKTLRAFLHQNPAATIQQIWDAAWKAQAQRAYTLKIQKLEAKIEIDKITMDNFLERLRKHDEFITELREMAEKWRYEDTTYYNEVTQCADELTALLEKQNAK